MTRQALGRGIDALLPGGDVAEGNEIVEVDVGKIKPSGFQPRRKWDQQKLEELAASIREHGVIQPLVLRPRGEGYELVAGERRLRAAQVAGLKRVPAVIKDFNDLEAMEVALVENLQREDLDPLEEARAYRTLIEELGLTQEEVARRVGKSRPHIANMVRLLSLDEKVLGYLEEGRLSVGHAKALLAVGDPVRQQLLASRAVAMGLSVRQVEKLVQEGRRPGSGRGKSKKSATEMGAAIRTYVELLEETLGTRVTVSHSGRGRGSLIIEFYSEEDFERIAKQIINGCSTWNTESFDRHV